MLVRTVTPKTSGASNAIVLAVSCADASATRSISTPPLQCTVSISTRLGVQMLTVHCSGGVEMLRVAEASAQETASTMAFEAPLVLGVTVLTSMDQQALSQTGVSGSVDSH